MKKILLGITLLSAIGVFSSCSDFLNEEPELKQSNELTFSKFESLSNAGAALYGMFQSSDWYDGQFILQGELRSGNAKNPTSVAGSGRYRQDVPWNYTESQTSSLWTYAYYTIARANNVINNLEGKVTGDVTQKDVDNLKAEALFIRALCHFDLVITYAQPYTSQPNSLGVPVVLITENGSPARNTVTEVYDQVVADLTEAESLMSDDFTRSDASDKKAVASKAAIQALLSRVYLYMGQWQKAADYATKVINNKKYSLATGEDYINMYQAAIGDSYGEIILEVYGSKKNEYWDDSGWSHLPYITAVDGYGDICATTDLVDLYEEGDIRAELFFKNENDNFTSKYKGKAGAVPYETNVPIIRLSEMYLNRAEAIINGASISGVTAESDLRAIAEARNATAPSPSKTTVLQERRKELAFEGHFIYDLARNGIGVTRTDYDATEANRNIPFPDKRWAMPIPKREMDANPNMVQNEGF
ncbi:MAG: RagB/SusD family nutrient uptake outer membrane protein [Prevotella sp.]|nr:RagB/SusD family nutrient uptake outer membrane protein [Prevotella sp.]